jgi:TRAP-type transport system periplasmic protein
MKIKTARTAWTTLASGIAVAASIATADAQTVLKYATTLPAGAAAVTEFFEPWAKRVTEAAGGEFQVQVVNGVTLANAQNVYERTIAGVTELSWAILGPLGVPFPKSTMSNLPFVVDNAEIGSVALWRLYEKGIIADEFKPVKMLGFVTTPPSSLHSKQPITKIADLKGLKIRSTDKISADTITALGGTPIQLSAQELYQSLSQGVIQAAKTAWPGIGTFKLQEVVHEHLEVQLGAIPGGGFMNKEAYEKLSAKGKKAIDDNSGEAWSRGYGRWFDDYSVRLRDQVKGDRGRTIRTLDAEEAKVWRAAVSGVIKQWIDRTPGGDAALAAYRAEIDKLKQKP